MSAGELRHHLAQIGSALIRIEQRLMAAQTQPSGHETGWTAAQWLKVLAGLALPLAALLLTGNIELARKLIVP